MRISYGLVAAGVLAAGSARAAVSAPHPGMKLVEHAGQGAMAVIDMCGAGVSPRITKYAEREATPEQWASAHGVTVASNGDFFDFPGWTYVIGRAKGAGEDWPAGAQQKEPRPYWQFGPGFVDGIPNGATAPAAGVTDIVGGHNVIISAGKTTGPWSTANDGALLNTVHTRTALGISDDKRTMYLLVTSDALTAQQVVDRMQAWAKEAGAPAVDYATNMDGGGSSQLYVAGRGQIVSTGRQVNDHVGFVLKGTGSPTSCMPKFAAQIVKVSFPGANDPALSAEIGKTVDGYVDVKNTGTADWTPNATKLAPTPRDKPSAAGGAGWLSPTRVSTVAAAVAPGKVGRFALKLTPSELGDHVYDFGLLEEGQTWFADKTLGGGPADDAIAVHLAVAAPGAGGGGDTDGGAGAGAGGGGMGAGVGDDGGAGGAQDGDVPGDDAGGCAMSTSHEANGTLASAALAVLALAAAFARRRRRR